MTIRETLHRGIIGKIIFGCSIISPITIESIEESLSYDIKQ